LNQEVSFAAWVGDCSNRTVLLGHFRDYTRRDVALRAWLRSLPETSIALAKGRSMSSIITEFLEGEADGFIDEPPSSYYDLTRLAATRLVAQASNLRIETDDEWLYEDEDDTTTVATSDEEEHVPTSSRYLRLSFDRESL
jgi:hypothetical protein